MLLDGEAEALTRKAVELALDGDQAALRLRLERVVAPRRERTVSFAMPGITGPADLARAMGAMAGAATEGAITPGEAVQFAQMMEAMVRAIQTTDFERRLREIEPPRSRWRWKNPLARIAGEGARRAGEGS
jgi:hypothetical protein